MIARFRSFGWSLSKRLSLTSYYLHQDLTQFAKVIGPTRRVVDIGSSKSAPYQSLFNTEEYVRLDYFESADVSGDAENLPFGSQVACAVILTEVLEHLPNPKVALQEIHRILNHEGFLIVTVPLIWGIHDYVDYQRWTESGLRKLLQETGYEIVDMKLRGGIFSMLGCMISQVPRQVFGELQEQNSVVKAFYVLSWVLLTPIPWLASYLDRFDKSRQFTLGYSVLCRRSDLQTSVARSYSPSGIPSLAATLLHREL